MARAAAYAPTERRPVTAPLAPLLAAPDARAVRLDELVFGESFDVLQVEGAFAFGRAVRDGYVGWTPADRLGEPSDALPTHRVCATSTFAFAEPSIRAPAFGPLGLNALVSVEAAEGPMARAAGAGWIPARHLAPIGAAFADPLETAGRFLGVPYLWGGRTSLGLDCSGLVQQALYAAGRAGPRDADQQAALGRPIEPAQARPGDLVAWRGHVGFVAQEGMLLHANAHHMAVALEPLDGAIARIEAAGGGPPTAWRRLVSPEAAGSEA